MAAQCISLVSIYIPWMCIFPLFIHLHLVSVFQFHICSMAYPNYFYAIFIYFQKLCPVNSLNLIRVFMLVGRDCYGGSDSWFDHGLVVWLDLCNTVHSCVCLFLYAQFVFKKKFQRVTSITRVLWMHLTELRFFFLSINGVMIHGYYRLSMNWFFRFLS